MADCNNDTPNYIVLPSQGTGTTGPAGPAGPQGPPGDVTGVTAADISVTNPGFNNVQEVLDFLLYIELIIVEFVANQSVYEIGTDFAQLGFTWEYNDDDRVLVSQGITGPNDAIVLNATQRSATLDFTPNLGSDHADPGFVETETFTLTADDVDYKGDPVQKIIQETVSFYSGIYYGIGLAQTPTSSFVTTLDSGPKLQSGRTYTFTPPVAAGEDEYIWYAHKKSLGEATFSNNGNPGGFQTPSTVSVTNGAGHVEDYYVYRSNNAFLGSPEIVVT